MTINAHKNAVFDVEWSKDDTQLVRPSLSFPIPIPLTRSPIPRSQVTSSGDHTSAIFSTTTQTRLATLHAHHLSVKSTHWHPTDPDLLVSCSRDGDIYGWDLRAGFGGGLKPVLNIYQAHSDTPGVKRRLGVKSGKGNSASAGKTQTGGLRSVTSVNYLPHRGDLILSSGSGDG